MLELKRGNLLEADVEALVNTVNTVGVMGKGIALEFKKAYPQNFKAYKKACDAEELVPGKMFVFQVGGITNPRYIINFPTKKHWRGDSKIEYIQEGLAALVAEVRALRIKSVAVPPLGCGHGGLQWSEVRPLIERAFASLPDVRVYLYEPAGAPKAKQMPNGTERPNMAASTERAVPGTVAIL